MTMPCSLGLDDVESMALSPHFFELITKTQILATLVEPRCRNCIDKL